MTDAKALVTTIQALSRNVFKQLLSELQTESPIAAKAALVERCKTDIELFALVFFPHYCRRPFNQFHLDCFDDWARMARGARRLAIAPRGSAKSTLTALIKPIHDLCYGLQTYIVILSNTETQAAGRTKDIRRELLENDLLRGVYGDFFSTKRPPETCFVATCAGHQCMFTSFGSGAEIRGIRFGERRPTKIVCDDIEHSEEVFNEAIREKYSSWYREVVSQIGDGETIIEVIGTLLHKKALLAELANNPAYATRKYRSVVSWASNEALWQRWRDIYGDLDRPQAERASAAWEFFEAHRAAMLEGSKVLWPENPDETYYSLMKLQYEIGRRAFMKERQNAPQESDEALFDRFHWYRETEAGLLIESSGVTIPWAHLDAFGVMDPSTGQTKARAGRKPDFTCILTGYQDRKGRLFVHSDWTRRAPPTQYIDAVFEQNDLYKYSKFGIEVNLYRNLLLPNMETEKQRREAERRAQGMNPWGINCPFYSIENVENKEKRIYTLEPKVSNGYIVFNRALSNEFRDQMEAFPLGEHDDCPDALEMLWGLANKRYGAAPLPINAMSR